MEMNDFNNLGELILQYATNKSELDGYKKICDRENAQIKSIMLEANQKEYVVNGYKATCTVSTRETMNEEGLLSLFTTVPSFAQILDKYNIIKTKQYVDFEALEKALYDDVFTDEQIEDIAKERESKEVVTLKVTKLKKKQED